MQVRNSVEEEPCWATEDLISWCPRIHWSFHTPLLGNQMCCEGVSDIKNPPSLCCSHRSSNSNGKVSLSLWHEVKENIYFQRIKKVKRQEF